MIIAKGAEAVIDKKEELVIKKRIPKTYRLKHIDELLRKSRTKREAKVIQKLEKAGIPVPKLEQTEDYSLTMQFIQGPKLRDVLDKKPGLARQAGRLVAEIHNLGIIHGDLTTSNMIFNKKIYVIDFGLSFFSSKIEDKAVDIHLFRQALESKHYRVYDKALKIFLEGYSSVNNYNQIMSRLEKVESRGRYKEKY